MIRWSYLGPRAALLVLAWAFFTFFMDPAIKWGAEKAGAKALGARFEIGAVNTDLFPPRIALARVAGADRNAPMKNLFEFAEARFGLEGRPLLERKFVVDRASLTGLRWGTARERSGALAARPASAAEKTLDSWSEDSKKALAGIAAPAAAAPADVNIDPKSLAAMKLSEGLESKWDASFGGLEKKVKAYDADAKIKEIEARFEAVKRSGSVPEKLKAAKELGDRVKALRGELQGFKSEAAASAASARADLDAIQRAKDGDLDALMARMNLPRLDVEALSAYLVGPKAAKALARAIRLAQAARKRMPPKGKAAVRQAARGEDVAFPKERSWPAFWLKTMTLAGEADLGGPLPFSGEAKHFSSSPAMIADAASLALSGERGATRLTVDAGLDHRSEIPKDSLRVSLRGLPMEEFTAGAEGFSLKIGPGTASLDGSLLLDGDALSGTVSFTERGVRITPEFGSGASPLKAGLASAFEGLDALTLTVSVSGSLESPALKVSSNLGEAAAAGLKRSLGKQFEARKAELRAKLDGVVGERAAALSKSASAREGALAKLLGGPEGRLNSLQDRISNELKAPVPNLKKLKLFR